MLKIKDGIELIELKKFGFVYDSLGLFGKGWYIRDWFKNVLIKVDPITREIILYSHDDTALARLYELFDFKFIERA